MKLIDQLRAAIKAELDKRDVVQAELDAVVSAAEARDDGGLTDDEAVALKTKRDTIRTIDESLAAKREHLAELEEDEKRKAAAAEHRLLLPAGEGVVRKEERTYRPDRREVSFFRDLLNRGLGDDVAAQRLARHQAEERIERGAYLDGAMERRDVGTSAFVGITVPQYLVDLVAPVRRALKPTADLATQLELPPQGMTVELSRVTTGTGTAVQATQNSAVQETDADDTALSVSVVTISGMQDVSLQAVRRGSGIDTVVARDLVSSHDTTLGSQVLNGAGSSGEHRGIRNVSGIISVTYTDASPTAAEAYPKLFDLISQVQSGVFFGLSHFVMHPRRWNWFLSQVGTSFPFVQQLGAAPQVGGSQATRQYGEVVGNLAGVPVVVDGNMVTNLGAGTNEDVVIGVTAEEMFLWTDPAAPIFIEAPQALANQLSVRYVVYSFSAFTAGRYPGAHGTIGGTGFVTPTF